MLPFHGPEGVSIARLYLLYSRDILTLNLQEEVIYCVEAPSQGDHKVFRV